MNLWRYNQIIGLWRYNQIIGLWRIQRFCSLDTAQHWLELFRKDEPNAHFALSKNKPRFDPTKK